jgi:hypothetical protein
MNLNRVWWSTASATSLSQAASDGSTHHRRFTVLDVFDKGKDKGAIIRHQTVLKEEGRKLATLVASRFARGDGGFGGPSGPSRTRCRSGRPTGIVDITTRPDQALVYRLCGDRNPLPPIPNLPGRPVFRARSCTAWHYGITCRGAADMRIISGAFRQRRAVSAPVFPADRDHGIVEGRQCDLVRGQGEGARRHRDQERQDGAGVMLLQKVL